MASVCAHVWMGFGHEGYEQIPPRTPWIHRIRPVSSIPRCDRKQSSTRTVQSASNHKISSRYLRSHVAKKLSASTVEAIALTASIEIGLASFLCQEGRNVGGSGPVILSPLNPSESRRSRDREKQPAICPQISLPGVADNSSAVRSRQVQTESNQR